MFFASAKDVDGRSWDNAVPGLNALAGLRFYLTDHVALFGEDKYNRASFNFDKIDTFGSPGGFKGDYSVSHFVGGLSFHF